MAAVAVIQPRPKSAPVSPRRSHRLLDVNESFSSYQADNAIGAFSFPSMSDWTAVISQQSHRQAASASSFELNELPEPVVAPALHASASESTLVGLANTRPSLKMKRSERLDNLSVVNRGIGLLAAPSAWATDMPGANSAETDGAFGAASLLESDVSSSFRMSVRKETDAKKRRKDGSGYSSSWSDGNDFTALASADTVAGDGHRSASFSSDGLGLSLGLIDLSPAADSASCASADDLSVITLGSSAAAASPSLSGLR